MTRLDRVATVQARIGWKALTADEYVDDGIAFLATPNIKGSEIDFVNVNFITAFRYEESPNLRLRAGDVLLAKDGSTLGLANLVRNLPRPATVNGSIAVLRPFAADPRYLMYWLKGHDVQAQIERLKDGMGVPHLFQKDIRKLKFPKLDPGSQRRIADFLDDRIARIDQIIAARSEQVSRLLDIRSSAADAALDSARPSGQVRLGYFVRGIEQGWSPQCEAVPAGAGEWGVLKVSAVNPGLFRPEENKRLPDGLQPLPKYEVQPDDLLITRANTPLRVGAFAVVPTGSPAQLMMSDKIMRVRLATGLSTDFVALVGQSRRVRDCLNTAGTGTSQTMVNIRGEDVRDLLVPALSLTQQRRAVELHTAMVADLDQVTERMRSQTELLTNYKSSVITAAVTGQLDVTTAGSGIPG